MNQDSTRQRAFLAGRPIFSGQKAQLRKDKAIRKLVLKHRSTFAQLLRELGEPRLVGVLQDLLKNRTFESELRAKAEFPWLFEAPEERGLEREASEAEAALSMHDALENIDSEGDGGEAEQLDVVTEEAQEDVPYERIVEGRQHLHLSMPSLYPCFLPFQAQHVVLTTIQNLLEESCFEFASKWLPDELEARGWDCPAAVELTKWAKVFMKNSEKLPSSSAEMRATSLKRLLIKNHNTRHIAVHRLPTSARAIILLLKNAAELVAALDDSRRAIQLETFNMELEGKIQAMELNKNVLENTTSERLQEIRRQREELDRQEKALITGMVSDDLKKLVGMLLEQSVDTIFASDDGPMQLEENAADDYDSGSDDSDGDIFEESVSVRLNGIEADSLDAGDEDDHVATSPELV